LRAPTVHVYSSASYAFIVSRFPLPSVCRLSGFAAPDMIAAIAGIAKEIVGFAYVMNLTSFRFGLFSAEIDWNVVRKMATLHRID
jgi:hypothetical protein